ncbi:immunity protein YezG family protein [Enterovibrio norvegicus]|uniref:immunity protein YezG family protein n=1 Tax=Enterovibrio norvegicus TaxID=188144 RepID=UPI000C84D93D|nr:immunity protein YezG family protein [Enterovibrio norvegicus]PMN74158.1 hypothetical protein BCT27_00845 [Enterovibrio norvegicus]
MNSEDSTKLIEKIALYLSTIPTSEWEEICVEAEIDDSMADLCIWVVDATGKESYPEVTRELVQDFVSLRKIISQPEKGIWTKCLYTLAKSGKFNTKFSYGKPRWA